MPPSDNEGPEYTDDEESTKEIRETKSEAIQASNIDEELSHPPFQLPSQMSFKPQRHDSNFLPPFPNSTKTNNAWKQEFTGKPRLIKRKPQGQNPSKPKTSTTNSRVVKEGTEFVNEEIKIYYQSAEKAEYVEPFAKNDDLYQSFEKSDTVPESQQFFDPQLIQNLSYNGITKLRSIQTAMLTSIFSYPIEHPETAKADILATSKTGSGKTLAFLLPILQKCIEKRNSAPPSSEPQQHQQQRPPTAIIFVNSLELAQSITYVLKGLTHRTGIKVVTMAATLKFLHSTFFDIGICTVGRFLNHYKKYLTGGKNIVHLDLSELEYIVIDEVDKMAADNNFVNVLEHLKEEPKKPRIFGFSATIDSDTTQIVRYSSLFQIKCGEQNSIPSNIEQHFWSVTYNTVTRYYRDGRGKAFYRDLESKIFDQSKGLHPFDTLYRGLTEYESLKTKRTLVFCKRTRIADYISLRLRDYGIPAVSIHKKLDNIEVPIDHFNSGKVNIAVVTQYFTRGIDTEVDLVINYDLPVNPLDFIHRCGRTGRNGNKGIVITFIDMNDPVNYNPEVIDFIVEGLAKKEASTVGFKAPQLLKKRVDQFREWNNL